MGIEGQGSIYNNDCPQFGDWKHQNVLYEYFCEKKVSFNELHVVEYENCILLTEQ